MYESALGSSRRLNVKARFSRSFLAQLLGLRVSYKVTMEGIIIISTVTVFAGVLFVHQPGANHAPGASVTQVNLSVQILSTFLRIRADPSMQIF